MNGEQRAQAAAKIRTTLFKAPPTVRDEVMQQTIDYVFGEIWSRPGLPIKTRSMIVMAVLTADMRSDQLRQHIEGALNIGITPDEIREMLLQVSAYAGAPVFANGLKIASEVFAQAGVE